MDSFLALHLQDFQSFLCLFDLKSKASPCLKLKQVIIFEVEHQKIYLKQVHRNFDLQSIQSFFANQFRFCTQLYEWVGEQE